MANVENLKIIHLLTGQELMAEVVSDTADTLTVKNPVRIVVVPGKTGDASQPSVGLAPFMQFSDDKELTLNKACVLTTATPITEFVNQYNTVFGLSLIHI